VSGGRHHARSTPTARKGTSRFGDGDGAVPGAPRARARPPHVGPAIPGARGALPRPALRPPRRALLANFRFWLAFPSDPTSAYSAPLPSCRGALCCARFAGPTGPLATQLVAGASSRVLSLAAGFRGDRTDLEVLKLSSLYQEVEQGKLLDSQQYLVGDGGGYPLLPEKF